MYTAGFPFSDFTVLIVHINLYSTGIFSRKTLGGGQSYIETVLCFGEGGNCPPLPQTFSSSHSRYFFPFFRLQGVYMFYYMCECICTCDVYAHWWLSLQTHSAVHVTQLTGPKLKSHLHVHVHYT